MTLAVERLVMLALRANASAADSDQSPGLMEYMQTTLALGPLAIVLELSGLLRCVLVNSTRPSDDTDQLELKSHSSELITEYKIFWMGTYDSEPSFFSGKSSILSPTVTQTEQHSDQPRSRFWFRRMNDVMKVLYFVALATGVVGNALMMAQHTNMKKNYINQTLRCTSSWITLSLALCVCGVATWAGRSLSRVNRLATSYLVFLGLLLVIPSVYRLTVMRRHTTGYESSDPGSYNSSGAKACFYTLHILPEWIASCIMSALNVRETFGTGFHGDYRWRDETAEEKEEREEKEKKKREKKNAEGRLTQTGMAWFFNLMDGKKSATQSHTSANPFS